MPTYMVVSRDRSSTDTSPSTAYHLYPEPMRTSSPARHKSRFSWTSTATPTTCHSSASSTTSWLSTFRPPKSQASTPTTLRTSDDCRCRTCGGVDSSRSSGGHAPGLKRAASKLSLLPLFRPSKVGLDRSTRRLDWKLSVRSANKPKLRISPPIPPRPAKRLFEEGRRLFDVVDEDEPDAHRGPRFIKGHEPEVLREENEEAGSPSLLGSSSCLTRFSLPPPPPPPPPPQPPPIDPGSLSPSSFGRPCGPPVFPQVVKLGDVDPDKNSVAFARMAPDGWMRILPRQWIDDADDSNDGLIVPQANRSGSFYSQDDGGMNEANSHGGKDWERDFVTSPRPKAIVLDEKKKSCPPARQDSQCLTEVRSGTDIHQVPGRAIPPNDLESLFPPPLRIRSKADRRTDDDIGDEVDDVRQHPRSGDVLQPCCSTNRHGGTEGEDDNEADKTDDIDEILDMYLLTPGRAEAVGEYRLDGGDTEVCAVPDTKWKRLLDDLQRRRARRRQEGREINAGIWGTTKPPPKMPTATATAATPAPVETTVPASNPAAMPVPATALVTFLDGDGQVWI